YASGEDVDFILGAVELVADHGDKFLPLYELGWRDGVWTRRGFAPPPPPFELSLASMRAERAEEPSIADVELARERAAYLAEALRLARDLPSPSGENPSTGDADLDRLIWFRFVHASPVPSEAEAAKSLPPLASE